MTQEAEIQLGLKKNGSCMVLIQQASFTVCLDTEPRKGTDVGSATGKSIQMKGHSANGSPYNNN